MVTVERMRAMALELPEAEEKSHFGHPDFRVRNKIFATLWPEEKRGVVKLPLEVQELVTRAEPETFSIPPGGERGGWTRVALPRIAPAKLRELLELAWREVAPKRLVAGRPGSRGR